MHDPIFEGVGTAIVTPFDEENNINFDRFGELIEFQIENNVDAIVVAGTTGEPSTLDDSEYRELVDFAIRTVNRRVPVIIGAGSNNTKTAIKKAILAKILGADGILLITPYYNKTSQLGLIKHYEAVCGSMDLPAILYNVPSRTGMTVELDTYTQLAKIPNLVGIKDATGDLGYVARILSKFPHRFDIYCGNDNMIVPYMSLGALGAISVASNVIPDVIFDICDNCLFGKFNEARILQLKYLKLIDALFCEVNPIPVKAAMKLINLDCGSPRPPLCDLSFSNFEKLEKIISYYGSIGN